MNHSDIFHNISQMLSQLIQVQNYLLEIS
jgi:hypothetical protein